MASLSPAAIRLTRMASDEASRAVAAGTAGTAATVNFGRLNTLSILKDPLISLLFLQLRSRQPSPLGRLELRLASPSVATTDRDALAPVLLAPFRAGPPHIVQLVPVRIEQRGPQPAPPPSDRVQAARRPMGRKQHSRDIRI